MKIRVFIYIVFSLFVYNCKAQKTDTYEKWIDCDSFWIFNMYNGIMTAASSDFNRSEDVAIINIKEMINAPLKGKVNKECNNPAGKGTIINNSGYTNDQLKNGKIIR